MLQIFAGIPDEVINDPDYEKFAQDASLLMKVNNPFAHTGQPKPNGIDNILYNSGKKGYENCNIANGYSNLFRAVKAWVRDEEGENLINRRRIYNPIMKKIGLGGC